MLIQQTLTKLHSLKLSGMAQGFEEQLSNAAAHSLAFEDRFAMLAACRTFSLCEIMTYA